MTVTDTWSDWTTDPTADSPPGTATPEIDDEIRNIKAQVKANVMPSFYFADFAGLQTLVTSIGSDQAAIVTDQTITVNPSGATYTIPANITVKVIQPGQYAVSNGKTLVINGPIEAGPYQIFSWTGTGAIDISGSPTAEVPIQWFGGATGRTTDNAAPLLKAFQSCGSHQTIRFSKGEWGLLTPVTYYKDSALASLPKLKGDSIFDSRIYINVGAFDGITIGDASNTHRNLDFYIDGLYFCGPTGGCTNGLHLVNVDLLDLGNIGFACGATNYALNIESCIYVKRGIIEVGHGFYGAGINWPANCIIIQDATVPYYASNVVNLHVQIHGASATGIGVNYVGNNLNNSLFTLTGSIEGCNSNPLIINNSTNYSIDSMYGEANVGNFQITNSVVGRIANMFVDTNIEFTKCQSGQVENFACNSLIIDNDCRGMSVGNGTPASIVDLAPDTVYLGVVNRGTGSFRQPIQSIGSGSVNILHNANFSRWASTYPSGWTIGSGGADVWTKETSIVHWGTNSAKLVTNAADAWEYYALSAAQIQALKGKWANFTAWLNVPSGTFTQFPRIDVGVTVPNRQNSHAYTIGEAVLAVPDSGKMYVCIASSGNTAGSQPTMGTTDYAKVTDGGVTWLILPYSSSSWGSRALTSADVGAGFVLQRADTFVPTNASACICQIYLWRQTGGADATVYMADPCLMSGGQSPRGYQPGADEHSASIYMGGSKLTVGASGAEPSNPLTGDLYWINNVTAGTTTVLEYYNGTSWVSIAKTP